MSDNFNDAYLRPPTIALMQAMLDGMLIEKAKLQVEYDDALNLIEELAGALNNIYEYAEDADQRREMSRRALESYRKFKGE